MDVKTRLLYWLLCGTRGGPTRIRIVRALNEKPMNMRQLSLALSLDYKTVQGHVELLIENSVLDIHGKKYGAIYFLAPEWEQNSYLKELIGGNVDAKK